MIPNDFHNRDFDQTDRLSSSDEQVTGGLGADCQDLEQELFALGHELNMLMPTICVKSAVFEGLNETSAAVMHCEEEGLQEELFQLGDALSGSAPEVDLRAAIMAKLESLNEQEEQTVKSELTALGQEIRAKQPRTNVVEPVLVKAQAQRDEKVLPFQKPAAPRRRESMMSTQMLLTLAACLLLAFGVLFTQMIRPALSRWPLPAVRTAAVSGPASPGASEQRKERAEGEGIPLKVAAGNGPVVLSSLNRPTAYVEEEEETSPKASKDEYTLADILNQRQQALDGKSEALALLARWGALDPDQARKLLAEGSLSPSELAALSRFLPKEEAIALLRDAVKTQDQDPALRLALARLLGEDPQYQDEAQTMHTALRGLDPDNSLFFFMDAQVRFAAGDYSGAVEALQEASRFSTASAYGLANAQNHRAVLEAAGYPEEVAGALAASYAGTEEYVYLQQMREELLDYGNYFESIGDYETAFAIYKSIGELGSQLLSGASYANEQLAGLDMQMSAVDAISLLMQMLNIPGAAQAVENNYDLFAEGLDLFLNNLSSLDQYLRQGNSFSLLSTINEVLQNGEISFLQNRLND
jgi:hypothetical protein